MLSNLTVYLINAILYFCSCELHNHIYIKLHHTYIANFHASAEFVRLLSKTIVMMMRKEKKLFPSN